LPKILQCFVFDRHFPPNIELPFTPCRVLIYEIHQKTKMGNVRALETVTHQPLEKTKQDKLEAVCAIHRVAQFNEGDEIYIHISGASTITVSRDSVNEFGMFEI